MVTNTHKSLEHTELIVKVYSMIASTVLYEHPLSFFTRKIHRNNTVSCMYFVIPLFYKRCPFYRFSFIFQVLNRRRPTPVQILMTFTVIPCNPISFINKFYPNFIFLLALLQIRNTVPRPLISELR